MVNARRQLFRGYEALPVGIPGLLIFTVVVGVGLLVHIYSNNCGQRVVMPNGDIMMSFTFGPEANNRVVAGVRCSFDGEDLKVLDVGPPLENNVGRGLLEPSLTVFRDRFYLTIRAEDGHGYVAVSDDGLNYRQKTAWAWDDSEPIAMSTTQLHWLTHSDGLFLVYTRKDPSNINVIRWRSPLWVARVDTERLCLIRESDKVVLPVIGDGVNAPNDVALMGNFHVTNVMTWVGVGTIRYQAALRRCNAASSRPRKSASRPMPETPEWASARLL